MSDNGQFDEINSLLAIKANTHAKVFIDLYIEEIILCMVCLNLQCLIDILDLLQGFKMHSRMF